MSSKKKNNHEYWDNYRGKIYSSKGGRITGEDVYSHGHAIMKELIGNISYMQMVILNVTGRLVEKRLADWFEAHFICLSWPDPRIWCNHIGALAGTSQTAVVAATLAGVLGADSRIYGGSQTSIPGMNFIKKALAEHKAGKSVEDIINECPIQNSRPHVMGYVRPVNGKDERIEPIEKITKKLGFETGEHLTLAYKISDFLYEHHGEGINIGGYAYAFTSDQGFSSHELYYIRNTIVASGVTACFIDTVAKPSETFLPLRCEDINYQGVQARTLT